MAQSLVWTVPGAQKRRWDLPIVDPGTVAEPASSPADLGEADLVAACVAGRTEAFEIIVERHRRSVYQLCYRYVGNHEDASDLTQDVFLRAYRALGRFRGQSALSTWLYRIAVNVCLNRLAASRPPSEPIEGQQLVDTRSDPADDGLLRAERRAAVRQAVSRLPAKQRAALIMRIYQEMSHQEIAEVLGSSVGAVKANVFHALRNLRKALGRDIR
jgi:RNA polymerase sigma-70 factor (ECF subfamily)